MRATPPKGFSKARVGDALAAVNGAPVLLESYATTFDKVVAAKASRVPYRLPSGTRRDEARSGRLVRRWTAVALVPNAAEANARRYSLTFRRAPFHRGWLQKLPRSGVATGGLLAKVSQWRRRYVVLASGGGVEISARDEARLD